MATAEVFSRRHFKLRFAACAVLVLLGMMCAWAAGYVAQSPLSSSESVSALIDFDAGFVARCA